MKKNLKRASAILLCAVMMVSLCTPVFALDGKTEQYARKAAAAGISKAAGQIPVVGEVISEVIDTFLPDMLGVADEQDEIMEKLDEIYDSIQNLSLKMDEQQQALFYEFYQQKIAGFNSDANKLKGTIDRLYTLIMEIEEEYGNVAVNNGAGAVDPKAYEKQVQLANLIKSNDFGDPNSAISQLINLTDYVCGTQISAGR